MLKDYCFLQTMVSKKYQGIKYNEVFAYNLYFCFLNHGFLNTIIFLEF